VRPHLPEEELHAWLDGQLSPSQRAEIAEHLLGCLRCRALEGEVRGVRDRAGALLALAAPRHRVARSLRATLPRPMRRRLGKRLLAGGGVVAALLALGIGLRSDPVTGSVRPVIRPPTLATALVAQPVPRPVEQSADVAADRTLTLASRVAVAPSVVSRTPIVNASTRPLRPVDPMASVELTDGWETTSFHEATRRSRGALARLDGVAVTHVRLTASRYGGRPVAMTRQVLNDGRAVWVIEGAAEELGEITQMLSASGLHLSAATRARPDYIGPDEAPVRTIRMAIVAGYLPVDSLDALAGDRLRLD
jgi:hypothetical protein